ncbi:hypothetical protein H310_11403 [Aphanomyces invadans]|uniref:Uncharacterized protein n=1 Tax=Aphanomyces invadans TaxID=157072 RepID=A0A024TLU8_9STRA|nr:hypothetical protein H310_11403 [Aphanomyces invadans]ETV95135.1 hypothetical protein H310_11403 [Aphanomyces invadans]|eukprot:XP_008876308.1 hypothetical protein H310_11403 [Aphanomyces invadans]
MASGVLSLAGTAQQDIVGLDTIRFHHVATSQLHLPFTFHVVAPDVARVGQALLSLQYLLHATVQYEFDTCGDCFSDWTVQNGHAHVDDSQICLYRPFTTCDVYVPVMGATSQVAILHVRAKWIHPDLLSDEGLREVVAAAPQSSMEHLEHEGVSVAPMILPRPTTKNQVDDGNGTSATSTLQQQTCLAPGSAVSNQPQQNQGCSCGIALQRDALAAEKKAWEFAKRKQQAALEQAEAKRMEALEAEWALREKERIQMVREAQQEYVALEKKLRQTLHDLDLRERSLAKAEEAFQHKLALHKQEVDSLQRKSKSETQHALSLAEQQKQSSELQCRQMEERAIRAESQLKQLEADIVALRVEQRKSPENVLRQDIIQHQATIAALEKQLRLLQVEKDQEIQVQKELAVQVDRLTQLLHQEKRKQDEQKAQDLEALRLKYIAREERFVLDGDREELRAIKKQLDMLRLVQFSQDKELARLQQEKVDLLATGQYTEDSFVIQELNRLIAAKKP